MSLHKLEELHDLSTNDINSALVELIGDISNPKQLDLVELEQIIKNDVNNKTYSASMYIAIGIFNDLREKRESNICDIVDYYLMRYLYFLYIQTNLGFDIKLDEKIDVFFIELFRRFSVYKKEKIFVLDDNVCDIVTEIKLKKVLSNFGLDNSMFFLEKMADNKKINISSEISELPLVGDILTQYYD